MVRLDRSGYAVRCYIFSWFRGHGFDTRFQSLTKLIQNYEIRSKSRFSNYVYNIFKWFVYLHDQASIALPTNEVIHLNAFELKWDLNFCLFSFKSTRSPWKWCGLYRSMGVTCLRWRFRATILRFCDCQIAALWRFLADSMWHWWSPMAPAELRR